MHGSSHTSKSLWFGALAFVLFALVPLLAGKLAPNRYEGGRSRDEMDRMRRNSSAVGLMLGEFRTSLSDIMFIKTDRYLHNGVAYVPDPNKGSVSISQADETLLDNEHEVHDDHDHSHHDHAHEAHSDRDAHDDHAHDEHNHPPGEHDQFCQAGKDTVIVSPDADFRGWIGDLHRQVKPWRDSAHAHHHSDGVELLPWYRLMTLSDPHYVRAYTIGGWWLKKKNLDESIRFLREGAKNNPDQFQIHYMLGQVLFQKGKQLAGADIYDPGPESLALYREAQQVFERAAELALIKRPPGWDENDTDSAWDDFKEDDARAAARMAVLMEKQFGDPQQALALARRYIERLGGDGILEKNIHQLSSSPMQ